MDQQRGGRAAVQGAGIPRPDGQLGGHECVAILDKYGVDGHQSDNLAPGYTPGRCSDNGDTPRSEATFTVKAGLAEMLKGGVIMDVVTPSRRRSPRTPAPPR